MDARELFLSRYAPLRGGYINKVWERLDAAQMRSQAPGLNSIAWNVWHIARAEDVGVNRFVADRGQVLDDEGWLARLGIDIRHQGTGQTAEEATATTTRLDLEALRACTEAVEHRTRIVVEALEPDLLGRTLEPERIRQVLFYKPLTTGGHHEATR